MGETVAPLQATFGPRALIHVNRAPAVHVGCANSPAEWRREGASKERMAWCSKPSFGAGPRSSRMARDQGADLLLDAGWRLSGRVARQAHRGSANVSPSSNRRSVRGTSVVVATCHHAAATSAPGRGPVPGITEFPVPVSANSQIEGSRERFGRATTQSPGRDDRARRRLPATSHARPGASHMAQEFVEFVQR